LAHFGLFLTSLIRTHILAGSRFAGGGGLFLVSLVWLGPFDFLGADSRDTSQTPDILGGKNVNVGKLARPSKAGGNEFAGGGGLFLVSLVWLGPFDFLGEIDARRRNPFWFLTYIPEWVASSRIDLSQEVEWPQPDKADKKKTAAASSSFRGPCQFADVHVLAAQDIRCL
jgi:hypothetical protein